MILKPYFGEVAEWSIALDLKSSVRKYRGFESHPLRFDNSIKAVNLKIPQMFPKRLKLFVFTVVCLQ